MFWHFDARIDQVGSAIPSVAKIRRHRTLAYERNGTSLVETSIVHPHYPIHDDSSVNTQVSKKVPRRINYGDIN